MSEKHGKIKRKTERKKERKKNHTVAARAAPGDLGLKSHQKDYPQKLTYQYGHPFKYKPRQMLLNPMVPGS